MVVWSWNKCNNPDKEAIIHKSDCSQYEHVKQKNEQKTDCQNYKKFKSYEEAVNWSEQNHPNLTIRKCKKCFK